MIICVEVAPQASPDFFADFGKNGISDMLLEAIPAPVFCKNSEHIYTACNEDFLKFIGFSREELIGRNVFEIAPSDNAKIYREADEELFRRGGKQVYETDVLYADGSMHNVVFHKSVFSDSTGKAAGLIGIILDITSRKKAEQSLKESEALFQALVDNCPAYIFLKDPEGKYIISGDKFTSKVGWPKGHMLGKTDYEVFPEEIADILSTNDQKVIDAGRAVSGKESFVLHGHEITNLAVKFPLYGAEGQLKGVAGIATDISDLVAAENKLKKASRELEQQVMKRTKELSEEIKVRQRAEHELRKILAASPVAVGISEMQSGKLSFVNESMAKLLASTREELIGYTTLHFWKTPENRQKLLEEFEDKGETKAREIEIIRSNGEIIWVKLSWTKLIIDGDDKIVSWFYDISQTKAAEAVLKDSRNQLEKRVTLRTQELEQEVIDRKTIEEALREREAQFEASANSASDWFWGMDETYKFNSFSERLEEITGFDPLELIGKSGWKALGSGVSSDEWEWYEAALSQHKPFRDFKFDISRNNGKTLHVSISGIPIFDHHNKFKGYRGAGRDISQEIAVAKETQKMEHLLQQSQKMEAIGQLTGGVAHDFNNILAIILGNLELAVDDLPKDSIVQPYLKIIGGSAARGAQLTQRLLAYSRKQALHPQKVFLDKIASGILELIDRLLGKSITVQFKHADNLRPVFADPSQIENSLMNLCINSSDAMPGGGTLYIETGNLSVTEKELLHYPELTPGEYSWLSVRDTGTGMDPDTLEHIFEPFFTTKEVGKGTGLGLSMIYGFANQSNGTIVLESKPGDGTVATLLLPSLTD